MIGETISHYRIQRRLGAGGMGEVYLAHDLALGRDAALKVLPADFSSDLRARLLKEARASARLQHPGIATFYESGEVGATAFIAMEYVEGETLRARLRAGAMTADEAIGCVSCVLEALAHAHASGILHRDIKPENVMIPSGGQAKLLDFGLAKELVDTSPEPLPTATALTAEGFAVGTIGYMPPEQMRGDPVDARADLFSVGAVLYEAVSGRPAFSGRTPLERISAVMSAESPRLDVEGCPELAAVIGRALARDPGRRYPSASAFLSALRDLGSGIALPAFPDTFAVVDFDNLSRNPDDDWIGSGVAESLAADLSRVDGLGVVAREKILEVRAAQTEHGALDLGLRLGCRWVLSGSFQRMGPSLRITSRLVEVPTGRVVAADKHDGRLDEIFEMQDRLSAAAAKWLHLERPAPRGAARRPPRLEAYESYARGRRDFMTLSKGGLARAAELYRDAVAAEPDHAPALAGLAALHAMRFTYTTDPVDLEAVAGYAQRAVAADPELAEPHVWLGYARWRQGRLAEAIREEARAEELGDESLFAPYFAGCSRLAGGDARAAVPLLRRSLEIDDGYGWAWLILGWSHVELGNREEALFCLSRAVSLEELRREGPTVGAAALLGECHRRFGELDAARERLMEALAAVERSDHMYRDTFRGIALCGLGRSCREAGDAGAARAAFTQAVAHLDGRPRALAGGHLLVQSLCGLSAAAGEAGPFERARALFASRTGADFSWLPTCSDEVTSREVSAAAAALGLDGAVARTTRETPRE